MQSHPKHGALASIPDALQLKLDASGAKMDEVQWRRLPVAARRRLVDMPADTPLDRRALAMWVDWLERTFRDTAEGDRDGSTPGLTRRPRGA